MAATPYKRPTTHISSRGSEYEVVSQPLSSGGGVQHEVRRYKDGTMVCSCKGWQFSKENPKTCKHIREFTLNERISNPETDYKHSQFFVPPL